MSRGRTLLAAVGLLAFAVGLLAIASRSTAAAVPLGDRFVTVVGAVSVVAGLVILNKRRGVSGARASVPDVERPRGFPVPGDSADQLFGEPWAVTTFEAGSNRQSELRRRLTDVAVPLLANTHGCTDQEAEQLLATGEWTADARAAAFFMRGLPDWTPRSVRVRTILSTSDPVQRWAKHAADELWRIGEERR